MDPERRQLATMIAEALTLADSLDLAMVGISLNGALERLTGCGVPLEATAELVH